MTRSKLKYKQIFEDRYLHKKVFVATTKRVYIIVTTRRFMTGLHSEGILETNTCEILVILHLSYANRLLAQKSMLPLLSICCEVVPTFQIIILKLKIEMATRTWTLYIRQLYTRAESAEHLYVHCLPAENIETIFFCQAHAIRPSVVIHFQNSIPRRNINMHALFFPYVRKISKPKVRPSLACPRHRLFIIWTIALHAKTFFYIINSRRPWGPDGDVMFGTKAETKFATKYYVI